MVPDGLFEFPGRAMDPAPTPTRSIRPQDNSAGACNLASTLLDGDDITVDDLADLYHGRWGIEELCKVSKQTF